jgi:hypothetical protein
VGAGKRPSFSDSDPAASSGREAPLGQVEGDASPGAALVVPDLELPSRSGPASQKKPPERQGRLAKARPTPPASEPPSYSGTELEHASGIATRIELEAQPFAPPRRSPARASPLLRDDDVFEKPRRSWGKVFLWFVLLVLAAGAAGVYEAPFYAKQRVAEAAKRSGLTVRVGDIVFRPRELVLSETKVVVQGLAGATLTVGEVEVALEGIKPRAVSVRGFDVTFTGSIAEALPRLEKWAAALPEPLRLEARSGHIHWANPWGSGTDIEASDVSASTVSAFSVSSPSVLVSVPNGKLGPWKLNLERTAADTRLMVGLDPASPPSSLKVNEKADGQVTTVLDIPLSPLSRVGIPPESLGLLADPYIEMHVQLDSAAPPKVSGKIAMTLSNLRSDPSHGGGAPIDAQLIGGLSGNLGELIPLTDGLVSMGPIKGKFLGTLSLEASAIRLNLALRWPAVAGKAALPTTVVLDTRDLWGTGRP